MHFAFILKVQYPDGVISHIPWQRHGGTRRETEKEVRASFERDNVYGPLPKDPARLAELLDVLDGGECADGYENSTKLYDAACQKATKLDTKAVKKDVLPPATTTAAA